MYALDLVQARASELVAHQNLTRITDQLTNVRCPFIRQVDAVGCFLVVRAERKEPWTPNLGQLTVAAAVMRKVLIKVGLCLGKSFVSREPLEFPSIRGNLRILDSIIASPEWEILWSHLYLESLNAMRKSLTICFNSMANPVSGAITWHWCWLTELCPKQ